MANPTPVPSNVPRPNGLPPHGGPVASVPSNGEPRIKTEPGLEEKPNFGPNYENHDAQRRAMAQLQQKYGADANTQINKLASQINHTGQGRGQVYPQRPNMTPEQQRDQQAEYQRRQHAAAYQNMQRAQFAQSNGNHHDGSAEWSGYVNDQRKRAQESGHEADQTIRHQVDQMKRTMEGGGVLQPLSEQGAPVQVKRRKVDGADGAGETRVPQVDGAEEDDEDSKSNVKDELFEDDEDAINSDLDDPDDNEIEEEPEDGKPTQVMLCTYDKVQRVKNKWKCTLRDGVLNSGGKEYVELPPRSDTVC